MGSVRRGVVSGRRADMRRSIERAMRSSKRKIVTARSVPRGRKERRPSSNDGRGAWRAPGRSGRRRCSWAAAGNGGRGAAERGYDGGPTGRCGHLLVTREKRMKRPPCSANKSRQSKERGTAGCVHVGRWSDKSACTSLVFRYQIPNRHHKCHIHDKHHTGRLHHFGHHLLS